MSLTHKNLLSKRFKKATVIPHFLIETMIHDCEYRVKLIVRDMWYVAMVESDSGVMSFDPAL